jgi:ABC-type sugar transport system, periplasmic component
MKAKKILAGLLCVILLVASFAACGGEKGKESSTGGGTSSPSVAEPDDGNTEESTEPEPAAVTDEPYEISIMSWHAEGGETKFYDAVKYATDAYTALHPNITFKYIAQPYDGYMEQLDTQFISESAADIIYLQPHMTRQFTDRGALLGLNKYMNDKSPYSDAGSWVESFSGGDDSFLGSKTTNAAGEIMFVPMDSSSAFAMGQPFFYNKDLFEKAGITETPKTFDEFLDVLAKLKESGTVPIAADKDRFVSWSLGIIGEQMGERYMDQYFDDKYNGSDKKELELDKIAVALANDEIKPEDQIVNDIISLFYDYSQNWQDGWTGTALEEANKLFLMQEAAIIQDGFWQYINYKELIGDDFAWDVFSIPVITKDYSEYAMEGFQKPTGLQDTGYSLNGALAKDEDRANVVIDFMRFLTSIDVQQEYVKIAVTFSPTDGVTQPEELQPFIMDNSLATHEQPFKAYFVDYSDVLWTEMIQEFATGKVDQATLLKNVIANSKEKAVEDCADKLDTLPQGIEDAEAELEELKADNASELVIQSKEKSIELLKLKLEMYEQYVK